MLLITPYGIRTKVSRVYSSAALLFIFHISVSMDNDFTVAPSGFHFRVVSAATFELQGFKGICLKTTISARINKNYSTETFLLVLGVAK